MDDYLSEKEQWEVVKTWIRENIAWILGGIAVGALALNGWRWWQGHQDSQDLAANAQYHQIMLNFDRGDRTQALALIAMLAAAQPHSAYVDQAELAAARVFVDSGELDKAASRLTTAMQNSRDPELALIARLRLARVELAQAKPDAALLTLNAVDPGGFAPRYHEARGDIYHAQGQDAKALAEYRTARSGDSGGLVDTSTLDLKITDLLADESLAPAAVAGAK